MSLYVLDTDMLTLVEEGHPEAARRFLEHRPEEVAITVISVEEQLSGWYTEVRQTKDAYKLAQAYKRLAACVRFLADMEILDFSESAIQRYQDLVKLKLKIGRTDLRIAATALEYGATVVTRNRRDFQQVPGLLVEDWSC